MVGSTGVNRKRIQYGVGEIQLEAGGNESRSIQLNLGHGDMETVGKGRRKREDNNESSELNADLPRTHANGDRSGKREQQEKKNLARYEYCQYLFTVFSFAFLRSTSKRREGKPVEVDSRQYSD